MEDKNASCWAHQDLIGEGIWGQSSCRVSWLQLARGLLVQPRARALHDNTYMASGVLSSQLGGASRGEETVVDERSHATSHQASLGAAPLVSDTRRRARCAGCILLTAQPRTNVHSCSFRSENSADVIGFFFSFFLFFSRITRCRCCAACPTLKLPVSGIDCFLVLPQMRWLEQLCIVYSESSLTTRACARSHLLALSLVSLERSVNKISSLRAFVRCKQLRELYLRKNAISDLRQLAYLRELPLLNVAWLSNNPVADLPQYRATVLRCAPGLQKLDNIGVSDGGRR